MTAYSREDHIELIVEVKQFYDRVKIVFPHTELEQLGLEPDSFSGMFFEESVDQLIEFCTHNSTYHIVTSLGDATSTNTSQGNACTVWPEVTRIPASCSAPLLIRNVH